MIPLRALVKLARPHQWVKNGFVFIGWLFGHGWQDRQLTLETIEVFVAFCLMSSAVYAFNDIRDMAADRLHPKKRHRPLATGAIGVGAAGSFAAVLAAASLVIAAGVSTAACALIAAYLALNVAYSFGLKNVPILDVFIIAAGFMLRILAGSLGIGVGPSHWLVVCGLLVTVFLGFAKRRAELMALEGEGGGHRPVLDDYTPALLDNMIAVCAAGVIVSYALYTVSEDTIELHGTDGLLWTLPFVLYGMFRFMFLLHRRGGGGDPAADLLTDPHLALAVLGWLGVTVWLLA